MANGKTKEQHYVPKMYMKNFTSNNFFNLIDIDKNKFLGSVPYFTQCKKAFFYDKDNSIEHKLSKLEQKWDSIIQSALNGSFPNNEEKKHLKEFAIYQRLRTFYKYEELLEMSWYSRKTSIEMKFRKECKNLDSNDWNKLKEEYINSNKTNPIAISITIAENIQNLIDDLKVAIIKYDTKMKLISSDNPIIHYNAFDYKSVGYISAGLMIFFPLSSDILCVIYDSKIYPKLDDSTFNYCKNEYDVKYLNYYQILNANKFIYFRDSVMVPRIMRNLESKKIKYYLQFPKININKLGDDTEKFISYSQKYIYLTHNFSFSKLSSKAKSVPNNAKDWFPRNFDEKYYNGKFRGRKKIAPLLEQLKNTKEFKNAMIWSDEEIDKFNNFVLDYWGKY